MKAAVLSAVGGPITIEDIPTPSPNADEVLVRVAWSIGNRLEVSRARLAPRRQVSER